MSDKPVTALMPLDRQLRAELPVTDSSGVQCRIEKIVGFELFNTRAYHNYETWSDGYRISGPVDARGWNQWATFRETAAALGLDEGGIRRLWNVATGSMQRLVVVEREDLDEAITVWLDRRDKVKKILEENPPGPNQRTRLAVLGYHYKEENDDQV